MNKRYTCILMAVITIISLWGCNRAESVGNASSVLDIPEQNSSSINSQTVSPTEITPTGIIPTDITPTDITPTQPVKREKIWSLIEENKVEDITPVFETVRYILDNSDSHPMLYKNIDYGALSYFKVDGRTGIVDDQGEIKIPYEDNASWCIEGFVDERHRTYDGEFIKGAESGHGKLTYFFDLNAHKLVTCDEDGIKFTEIDNYIKNNLSLSGAYRAAYFKTEGKALVKEKESDLFIVIDDKGNPISGPDIQDGTSFYDGISAIKKDNKWGFIDLKGNMILDFQYDYAFNFIDDTAAVCKEGKWGYIYKDGSIYKEFIFDAARSFYKGRAWVKLDGKWQVITK